MNEVEKNFKPENYPRNSIVKFPNGEEKVEKAKVSKIVSGNVTRKSSMKKKFSNFFLGSDSKTVTTYVVEDILIPAIKNTIVEAIYAVSEGIGSGFEMLFFGKKGARRRTNMYQSGQRSYVSYEAAYNNRIGGGGGTKAYNILKARHDFDDIIIESRGEAEEVISHLVDLIVDYGTASVADLYALVGINIDPPDYNYGWTDLRGACVVRVPNGYLLDLPKCILLDQ